MRKTFTKKDLRNGKKRILITAQAFYGNRTITRIKEEDMDPFILGYLDASLFSNNKKIDRTLIPIPGTEHLFLVYNLRFQ